MTRQGVGAVLGYLALYSGLLAWLAWREGMSPVEPLTILVILGGGFTALAWVLCVGTRPLPDTVRDPAGETRWLLLSWLALAVIVTWGFPLLRAPGGLAGELLLLLGKLFAFVGLPLALLRLYRGYPSRSLLQWPPVLRRHWLPLLGVSMALLALQALIGRGPAELAKLEPSLLLLAVVVPLAFAWLVLEVGLVEEFFFRRLLQSRLTAWTGSPAVAIVITALLFGLIHAPALYLRPELTGEAVGASPSLMRAVGYSVLITSTTGFFLGVLWQRTRNLWLLAIVHASADLVPGMAGFVRLFAGQ